MPGPTKSTRRPLKPAARPRLGRRVASGVAKASLAAAGPLIARPALSASIAVFAAFFGCVATNALYAQGGRHPHPLLTTRPVAGAVAQTSEDTEIGMPVPLVVEAQTALARAGYYSAPVDGRPGKVTSAAIRAFQSEKGLPIDGEASPKLLAALRSDEGKSEQEAKGGRVASLDAPETVPTNDASPPSALTSPAGAVVDRDLVRRVQEGLTSAKIAELHADGIMGSRTEAAIRTFQASQGLDVTGIPDKAVLARLKAVGASKR